MKTFVILAAVFCCTFILTSKVVPTYELNIFSDNSIAKTGRKSTHVTDVSDDDYVDVEDYCDESDVDFVDDTDNNGPVNDVCPSLAELAVSNKFTSNILNAVNNVACTFNCIWNGNHYGTWSLEKECKCQD